MSALYSIADSLLWYIICIAALILLTGSVSILFRTVFDTREISMSFLILPFSWSLWIATDMFRRWRRGLFILCNACSLNCPGSFMRASK